MEGNGSAGAGHGIFAAGMRREGALEAAQEGPLRRDPAGVDALIEIGSFIACQNRLRHGNVGPRRGPSGQRRSSGSLSGRRLRRRSHLAGQSRGRSNPFTSAHRQREWPKHRSARRRRHVALSVPWENAAQKFRSVYRASRARSKCRKLLEILFPGAWPAVAAVSARH